MGKAKRPGSVTASRHAPGHCSLVGFGEAELQLGVCAAANGRAVEADVAAAAALAALRQAVAAGLNHRTAGLVAARAADAAAVFGEFTLANSRREVALAAGDAVAGANAAAQAIGQHAAEVLQRAPGDFIIAAAMNLAAVRGLLEFDAAARQYTPIGAGWRAGRDLTGLNTLTPWCHG